MSPSELNPGRASTGIRIECAGSLCNKRALIVAGTYLNLLAAELAARAFVQSLTSSVSLYSL
jgi:hypothetical protein